MLSWVFPESARELLSFVAVLAEGEDREETHASYCRCGSGRPASRVFG